MNLQTLLQRQFAAALEGVVPDPAQYIALIKPAQDAKFGDYQANLAMPLAKVLGKKPRDVAQDIVNKLPLGDMLEPPEIAGPGFINLRFKPEFLARQIQDLAHDGRLGADRPAQPKTIVIDFSGPNVAKPMHVGHLR